MDTRKSSRKAAVRRTNRSTEPPFDERLSNQGRAAANNPSPAGRGKGANRCLLLLPSPFRRGRARGCLKIPDCAIPQKTGVTPLFRSWEANLAQANSIRPSAKTGPSVKLKRTAGSRSQPVPPQSREPKAQRPKGSQKGSKRKGKRGGGVRSAPPFP